LEIKEVLKEQLSLSPYASVSVFVMMGEEKGYNLNCSHLDKAYSHIEVKEYGRFKYTYSLFNSLVLDRVAEFASKKDNSAQK
jgi:hypothetical protein